MLGSKDILYLVIAFCIIWVTVFLCWMFYYVTRLLRNANRVVEEFRARIQSLTEAVHHLRSKVDFVHNIISAAGIGVGNTVKNMVSKTAKEYINKGTDKLDSAAKDAVDKAVEATAKGMKKMAKKMKM